MQKQIIIGIDSGKLGGDSSYKVTAKIRKGVLYIQKIDHLISNS